MVKNFITVFLCMFFNVCVCLALELDENDNNQTFEVKPEEKIAIRLNSNATTGYSWHFIIDDEEKSLIKVLKEKYEVKSHPKGMGGVGGKTVYKIKTLKPGKLTITARYYRPWEKFNPQNDKELKFFILVKD